MELLFEHFREHRFAGVQRQSDQQSGTTTTRIQLWFCIINLLGEPADQLLWADIVLNDYRFQLDFFERVTKYSLNRFPNLSGQVLVPKRRCVEHLQETAMLLGN